MAARTTASSASVTDGEALRALFQELVVERGGLDAVVNVAGITRQSYFASGTEEDFQALLSVHLGGYLNVLDAARQNGREQEFAIAGQDCIPEVLDEMRKGTCAIIGSISHGAESYGPRLIQLGITLLRGRIVPPYNYVRHHVVTPESLASTEESAPSSS